MTQYDQEDQPVGVYEISLLLGVEPATVSSWRQRKNLPQPAGHLNKGRTPFWKQGEILAWANATGRNKNIDQQAVADQVYASEIEDSLANVTVSDLEWDSSSQELNIEDMEL